MPTQTTSIQEGSASAPQPSIGEIFSKRAANMNRLLSRREKDGGAHRRAKSRDKSADKKVKCWEISCPLGPHSYWPSLFVLLNLLHLFAQRFRNHTGKARRFFSSLNVLFMQQLLILGLVSFYRLDHSLAMALWVFSKVIPRRRTTRIKRTPT